MQRGAVAGAFRPIPFKILSFDELGLPPVVDDSRTSRAAWCSSPGRPARARAPRSRRSSTRSTASAPMHILTIEDPIEYLHPHKMCVVNQREVGADTPSFKRALRDAPAPGPGRRARRRDARPRDDRGGAHDRRDRPPRVRDAAHELGARRPSTASSTSSRRTSRSRSARSCRSCSKASSARR